MSAPADPPGAEWRDPRRTSLTYAVRAPLVAWLRREAEAAAARRPDGYRLLDVGCGVKPYLPIFEAGAREYVGVDVDNEAADLAGPAEPLPVPDARFDLVLCTQVLDHA